MLDYAELEIISKAEAENTVILMLVLNSCPT
jgi:hypothetical protein